MNRGGRVEATCRAANAAEPLSDATGTAITLTAAGAASSVPLSLRDTTAIGIGRAARHPHWVFEQSVESGPGSSGQHEWASTLAAFVIPAHAAGLKKRLAATSTASANLDLSFIDAVSALTIISNSRATRRQHGLLANETVFAASGASLRQIPHARWVTSKTARASTSDRESCFFDHHTLPSAPNGGRTGRNNASPLRVPWRTARQ